EVAPGWTPGGKRLFAAPGNGLAGRLVKDGAGGYFFAWEDSRTRPPGITGVSLGEYADVYAIRLTSTGDPAPGWPASGVPVCVQPGPQTYVAADVDGSGGAFVAWGDYRSGPSDLYVSRLLGDGTLAPGWTPQGTRFGGVPGYQLSPWVFADGV